MHLIIFAVINQYIARWRGEGQATDGSTYSQTITVAHQWAAQEKAAGEGEG